jgi:hypothetical protein
MSYVDGIIQRFGGSRALARALARPPSTVDSWRARGTIPDAAKPQIVAAGRLLGIDLNPADFFPVADTESKVA